MTDVVVIGGGIAGWTAARRAQRLGLSVTLLEKATGGPGWSNSIHSAGRIHAAYLDPYDPPDDLYNAIIERTQGTARVDVARAWADNCGRALDFLVGEGAVLASMVYDLPVLVGTPKWARRSLYPFRTRPRAWEGSGNERLLTGLWQAFVRDHGDFFPGCAATELTQDASGAVNGVRFEGTDGAKGGVVDARTVVMADGGFQANRELMAKYVTTNHYIPLGSPYDTGDCLLMAEAIGAKLESMDTFYGDVALRDGLTNAKLFPDSPNIEMMLDASMVVDGSGGRIADEGLGTSEVALIDLPIAGQMTKANGDVWMIFDSVVWESVGRQPGLRPRPMNPTIVDDGGTLVESQTYDGLAEGIGVPADKLSETIERYNAFCTTGSSIDPPRSGQPAPVLQPPFYAIPIIVGIFFAMGGTLVNGRAQVLDQNEEPIPGLYAAGGTMAGLSGGPRNGYAGGWAEAFTFGLLAAEDAARYVGDRAGS